MGWIRDATGSFAGGLLVIASVCIGSAIAVLCVAHDPELERTPETAMRSGSLAASAD
jgi:MFS transporter, ACS family, tartrate transporter